MSADNVCPDGPGCLDPQCQAERARRANLEPYTAGPHGWIIKEAVEAALEFGADALGHARDAFREERIAPPADLDNLMFEALKAAGAFNHPARR